MTVAEQTCASGCVAEGATAAHCAYLEPRYVPDACDEPATEPSLVITTSATFDTNLDTNCTGGVVTQTGGPDLCVVRYGTFTIEAAETLTVTGDRALAVVTDGDLQIAGTLDAAAEVATSGPGGGSITSGTGRGFSAGGGGAGFHQLGGDGGSSTETGGGGAGGSEIDPLALIALVGGPRAGFGGGGGGGVTLISCTGTVIVSGTLDVGGGGGPAGFQNALLTRAGGGGGAGGQVVMQGMNVEITGKLYANGGGGGSGRTSTASGADGADGSRSSTTCASGAVKSPAGSGGAGGCNAATPADGRAPTDSQANAGGGGGSEGYFFVYVPDGVTPTLTPADASPPLSPTEIALTR